jgi:hypothetical protein
MCARRAQLEMYDGVILIVARHSHVVISDT